MNSIKIFRTLKSTSLPVSYARSLQRSTVRTYSTTNSTKPESNTEQAEQAEQPKQAASTPPQKEESSNSILFKWSIPFMVVIGAGIYALKDDDPMTEAKNLKKELAAEAAHEAADATAVESSRD